ncbi:MAG: class I SAM-dependent methyltransferase, partial [Thermoleophilaceae bacterium]
MIRGEDMARFWDERAREDPYFFVDSRLEYGRPDLERFWAGGEEDLDTILSALDLRLTPEDEVVELGCGIGRLTRALARRARSVRAVDVSARMIELAREHNAELDNVEWIVGDGASLAAIADASADACVSHVVLQHIPEPDVSLGYIREMGRVLRPGGWAAFQFSNDPRPHRWRLRHPGPRARRDRRWRGSALSLDDVRAAARDGGMEVERVVGQGQQHCAVRARALR